MRRLRIAGRIFALLLACMPACAQKTQWVGTWATAPMRDDSGRHFTGETLRQIVRISVGGSEMRFRISNLFGDQPLRVEDAHVALRGSGASVVAGSDKPMSFHGRSSVVIAPGAEVESDPVSFAAPALSQLAISFYLPAQAGAATFHPAAHGTNYIASGDVGGAADLREARESGSYYFLSNVDVRGRDVSGAVVTLGASITEGYAASDNTNRRWPDMLAERLATAGLKIGVLNEGISGNRLLVEGAGQNAEERFERDVLSQPGVRWVIFSDDPINDLGSTRPAPNAELLIAATRRIIAKAHEKHMLFFCSTLTPYEGANYWRPQDEQVREAFNAFVRSRDSGCDGVVDQDLATHDPEHPGRFLPVYDSGDHLHPNDAGHKAIADAIDLALFHATAKSGTGR